MEFVDRVKATAKERPLLLVCFSALAFNTQGLFVKFLTISGFSTFETIIVRGMGQGTGAACILLYWGEPVKSWLGTSKHESFLLGLRGFFGFGGIAFGFMAVQMTTLANSQVASQVTPVFSAILGCVVLGEPWLLPEFFATVATAIGVCLVFQQPAFIFGDRGSGGDSSGDGGGGDGLDTTSQLGIGFGLIGSFCASLAYCMIRLMGTTTPVPFPKLMFVQAMAQFFFSIPCVTLTNQQWTVPDTRQALMLLAGASLGFCGQLCMTIGMMNSKAASSSLMRQTGVVYAFMFDALLVPGESISLWSCLGALVITASTASLAYAKSSSTPPAAHTPLSTAEVHALSRAEDEGGSAGKPPGVGGPDGDAPTAAAEAPGDPKEGKSSPLGSPTGVPTKARKSPHQAGSSGQYARAACDEADEALAEDSAVEIAEDEPPLPPLPEFGFQWGERLESRGRKLPEDDPWAHGATWDDDDSSRGGRLQVVKSTLQRLVPPSFGSRYQRLMQGAGSGSDDASGGRSGGTPTGGRGGEVEWGDVQLSDAGEAGQAVPKNPYAFEDDGVEFA